MKKLILALCFIVAICAYEITKNQYDVVIESVEYTNIPKKYHLDKKILFPKNSFGLNEEIFKNITNDLKIRSTFGTVAVMNDYADKIFASLDKAMIYNGLDPIEMPNQHSGFSYTVIITFHGELDLTHGWLYDLSTMRRGGDVLVSYSHSTQFLEVVVPIAFDDLQFDYDYSAKIMGLGPTGGVHGKVANVAVEVKIGFNSTTYLCSLDEFAIKQSGHIDVSFNGNPLVDWLVNLLTDVVTALLKPLILSIVEGIIRGGLGSTIDTINNAVNGFLHPGSSPTDLYFN